MYVHVAYVCMCASLSCSTGGLNEGGVWSMAVCCQKKDFLQELVAAVSVKVVTSLGDL